MEIVVGAEEETGEGSRDGEEGSVDVVEGVHEEENDDGREHGATLHQQRLVLDLVLLAK